MRFLGVLGFGGIVARGGGQHVGAAAIVLGDDVANRGNGLAGDLHAVGAHIGDATFLIQALRDPHRVAGGKAQLACGFLLQGGGGERRIGVACRRLGVDGADGEIARLDIGTRAHRGGLVGDIEAIELLALKHA